MIMARRLTLEGAKVESVLEVQNYLSGLMRNYVQCLEDWNVPLHLRHTVKRVIGKNRVEAVEAVAVDEKWQFIPGTERIIPCDTLLLSVGLIPENELSKQAGVRLDPITGGPVVDQNFQTNLAGVFAAGNVVHVYDLVDYVSEAGDQAGKAAALFAQSLLTPAKKTIPVKAGKNVRYVVPHTLDPLALEKEDIVLQCRVSQPIEEDVWFEVRNENQSIVRRSDRYARPGEMVSVKLTPSMFADVMQADALTLDIYAKSEA
jgi:hypothetical protein